MPADVDRVLAWFAGVLPLFAPAPMVPAQGCETEEHAQWFTIRCIVLSLAVGVLIGGLSVILVLKTGSKGRSSTWFHPLSCSFPARQHDQVPLLRFLTLLTAQSAEGG